MFIALILKCAWESYRGWAGGDVLVKKCRFHGSIPRDLGSVMPKGAQESAFQAKWPGSSDAGGPAYRLAYVLFGSQKGNFPSGSCRYLKMWDVTQLARS